MTISEWSQEWSSYTGLTVKALYENGWFTGDIMYFNTAFEEYKVVYPNETSDYIRKDDFDGVQIILLQNCLFVFCNF